MSCAYYVFVGYMLIGCFLNSNAGVEIWDGPLLELSLSFAGDACYAVLDARHSSSASAIRFFCEDYSGIGSF